MTEYMIPFWGVVKAGIETYRAQHAFFVCHEAWERAGSSYPSYCWKESDATWGPFQNFGVGVISTQAFLLTAIVVLAIAQILLARKAAGGAR